MRNQPSNIISAFLLGATLSLTAFPVAVAADTKEDLEAELKTIETQIAAYEDQLATTQTEKQTLANKISQLKKEQSKVQLQIKATGLEIRTLDGELMDTQTSIAATTDRLTRLEKEIISTLRTIHEQDQHSMLEALIAENQLSAFFHELDSLQQLSQSLAAQTGEAKTTKTDLQTQYGNLETQQNEKKNLLAVQSLQQQNLRTKTNEQNTLLTITKGKEAQYQAMLADSKKRAQEIRNRIYQLLGVNTQITFGQAVTFAQWASDQTGVRTAFILAILTQESNLGQNVGTCNRPGDPASKSWKMVMKPARDQEPFLAIMQKLGMDPNATPVSCPMRDARGNQIGWGGAMGPAQFIPSTWVLYEDRISSVTGRTPANPWDMRDAFLATALLLKDNGAFAGSENSEWRAAMLYFSGSTNTRYRFYGDNVIAIARRYEDDIRALIG